MRGFDGVSFRDPLWGQLVDYSMGIRSQDTYISIRTNKPKQTTQPSPCILNATHQPYIPATNKPQTKDLH